MFLLTNLSFIFSSSIIVYMKPSCDIIADASADILPLSVGVTRLYHLSWVSFFFFFLDSASYMIGDSLRCQSSFKSDICPECSAVAIVSTSSFVVRT